MSPRNSRVDEIERGNYPDSVPRGSYPPDHLPDRDPLSGLLAALASDDRRAIIDLLARRSDRLTNTMSITEIAYSLELSRFSASRHLKILREAGVIRSSQVGGTVLNELDFNSLLQLEDWVLSITLRAAG